ncbi:MAG: outer membrane protein assembly factor BamA [Chthoniobacterales bacterium]|nr:MAG: outer membrane protein assembly factor BamA [Chthoniobacterales bacterium]
MPFFSLRRCCLRILLGLAVASAPCVSALRAQSPPEANEQQRQGPPIVRSIDVQYIGPVTISRERVLAQLRTKVGQPYSEIVAEEDIRNLFSTGAAENVRIFGEPQGDGLRVIVAIQTRSILTEIEIDGATRMSAKRLRKALGIKLNTPVHEEDLEKGRQKIFDTYQAHGFTDVDVKLRVEAIDPKRATSRAVYTITEGPQGAISLIDFEGNAHISARALRKQMKTKKRSIIGFIDKSGRLDEAQLQQDLQSVREYYQNHGFVDMQVREVRKERSATGRLHIVVVVDEGAQYHVGRISAVGFENTTEEKIKALLKVKEGSVYSPKAIREDAKAIADAYGAGGYVDTDVIPESAPARGGSIDLTYRIKEGERAFVERISIVGNTRTKDKVIRREVLITPGDVFNTVRVDTSKKRLENLGYFSKVEAYPVDTGVEGRKDLEIQVEEKRTGSLNFGAGFSTVDSLLGFVELTQGNFDITNWPNFTGGGQKFRIRLQGGTERKDAEVSLVEPWFLDRPLSLGGTIFYHEATFLSNLYDQRSYGLSLELRKPLRPYLYGTLGYSLQDYDIYNVVLGVTPDILAEEGSSTKSQVSGSLVWDRRDSSFLTRHGERMSLTTYVAGGVLGGTEQIYGFDLEGSKYFLLPGDTILLINAEAAVVDNWGEGSRVRIYDRLFLGGANNLRGFDFRDVGPKDAHGEPLGGKTLARATVEYTFPIIEKVRGALFYDTGFVEGDAYDFSTSNLASDVGFGVRLDLPVGPLRIDYGFPIEKAGTHGGGKFNFNVGYQF